MSRTSFLFVYGLQRWLCYFHGDHTRKPASRDAGSVISILHLCTLLMCALCFHCSYVCCLMLTLQKNSQEADRLAVVLEELPLQVFSQLMIKIIPSVREKQQYLYCRTFNRTRVMMMVSTSYIAHLQLFYREFQCVLLQVLASVWCSV